MKSAEDLLFQFDRIPKYLRYKGEVYVPIIYKHEWEFNDNAYWILFAKETQMGFSTKKVLFHVKSVTLEIALQMFYTKYDECCRDRLLSGREWLGDKPYALDFSND